MILDENPNFSQKFVKNLHIQNFNKKKKKIKVQFFFFLILLDLFYDCANFQVNRSISCRDLRVKASKRDASWDLSMGLKIIRNHVLCTQKGLKYGLKKKCQGLNSDFCLKTGIPDRNTLNVYKPSRNHRSSTSQALQIPQIKHSWGERAFSHVGPKIWNSLPMSLRNASSLNEFKSNLKSYLF